MNLSKRSTNTLSMVLASCMILTVPSINTYAQTNNSGYNFDFDESEDSELVYKYNEDAAITATNSSALLPRNVSGIEHIEITHTTDKDDLRTRIQNALNAGKDVSVSGKNYDEHGTVNNNLHTISISVPAGRKVTWDASISSNHSDLDDYLLRISGPGKFEFKGGTLKISANNSPASVITLSDNADLHISGGILRTESNAEVSLILAQNTSKIHMTNGQILAYKKKKTAISSDGEVIIDGGEIVTGADPDNPANSGIAVSLYTNNGNLKFNSGLILGYGAESADDLVKTRDGADKSLNGGVVIAYKKYTNPRTTYLKGSKINLSVLPQTAEAYWDKEGDDSVVRFKNGSYTGSRPLLNHEENSNTINEISYEPLGSIVYDANPHTMTQTPKIMPENAGNGTIEVKYKNSGNMFIAAPINAGKYTVYACVRGSSIYADEDIKLDEFEIKKRPVKLVIDDKTINAGNPLPTFTYNVEGLAGTHSASDAFENLPQLTANTDGKAAGTFDINISSALNYKENYTANSMQAVKKGKLTVKNADGSNPPPSQKPGTPQTPETPQKPGNNSRSGGSGQTGGSGGGRSGTGRSSSGGSSSSGSRSTAVNKNTGTWVQDTKGWWYKNPDGTWPAGKWLYISYNGKKDWYYFNTQGYMTTGWQLINNKWYYLYENTQNSLVKGSLAVNTVIGIYRVDGNGEWIK